MTCATWGCRRLTGCCSKMRPLRHRYDNLVTNHNHGMCATRQQQVSLHLGTGPGNKTGNGPFIRLPPKNLGMACLSHPTCTNIETPPRDTLYRRSHHISTPRCPRGGPCAQKLCVGSAPQTGALFQYVTSGGAGLASCTLKKRGTAPKEASRLPGYGGLSDSSCVVESKEELVLVFGVERRGGAVHWKVAEGRPSR